MGPSPRVRGALIRDERQDKRPGTILAGAGSTSLYGPASRSRRDHPRRCGEHGGVVEVGAGDEGPSPRVRGAPHPGLHDVHQPGTIPAGAGSRAGCLRRPMPGRDHPRARGDGPMVTTTSIQRAWCSPHPRGWSLGSSAFARPGWVLPAPAGMVPTARGNRDRGGGAPRTCGDGPSSGFDALSKKVCSPHLQGWSQVGVHPAGTDAVLPAPAGMVPSARRRTGGRWRAPRTRGDSPVARTRRNFEVLTDQALWCCCFSWRACRSQVPALIPACWSRYQAACRQ